MTPSNQSMRTYLVSLGILLLGLWSLEALLLYEGVDLFLSLDLGSSSKAWTLDFLLIAISNLIVGMVIIAVPSSIFAALLYLAASYHPRPAGRRAIFLSSIVFVTATVGLTLNHILAGGWPWIFNRSILFGAPDMLRYYSKYMTWQEALANPLCMQLLLSPILFSSCLVVGYLSRRRGVVANDSLGD